MCDGVDAERPGRKVVDLRPCFFRQIHQPGRAGRPHHFDRGRRRRSGANEGGTSREVGHGVGQSSRGSDLLGTAPRLVSHLHSSFWPTKGHITPCGTARYARLLGLSIRRLRVRAPSPSPVCVRLPPGDLAAETCEPRALAPGARALCGAAPLRGGPAVRFSCRDGPPARSHRRNERLAEKEQRRNDATPGGAAT